MAATDFIYARTPIIGAEPSVKNTSGSAMTVGQLVKLDASNPMSATQPVPGVVLTSAVTDYPYGILLENIAAGAIGRVATEGHAAGIAAGAITAGAIVGPSAGTAGDVTTYTAGDPSLGQAVTAAANAADPIVIRISVSKNA